MSSLTKKITLVVKFMKIMRVIVSTDDANIMGRERLICFDETKEQLLDVKN